MAMMKRALNAVTTPNTIEDGGGLSSLLIPVKVNALGAGLILAGNVGVKMVDQAIQTRNRNKMGKISYTGGPARMTGSFTSGAVQAMHRSSGGSYGAFSDMASEVMDDGSIAGKIQNYGVTPQFVSALYGMGR